MIEFVCNFSNGPTSSDCARQCALVLLKGTRVGFQETHSLSHVCPLDPRKGRRASSLRCLRLFHPKTEREGGETKRSLTACVNRATTTFNCLAPEAGVDSRGWAVVVVPGGDKVLIKHLSSLSQSCRVAALGLRLLTVL